MPDDPSNPAKKETFRINIPSPGSAGETQELGGLKKETVKISIPKKTDQPGSGPIAGGIAAPAAPVPPPAASRPFVPPPPPRPPSAPAAPVAPPAPPAPRTSEAVAPMTMKATQPKKETARIQLPPEPKPLPKATVRMQQTQPLAQTPAAQASSATITKVAATSAPADDSLSTVMAVGVFIFAALILAVQVLTFTA
jgi:hypothetical protein